MKHHFYNLLARLPFFSWLFPKLVCYEQELTVLRWEIGILKAEAGFPRKRENLSSLLALLAPRKPVGATKLRVGGAYDGAYIMLDDLGSITRAQSLGIADEVTWDLAMADRGVVVEQYDYSIRNTPVNHAKFHFYQKKIARLDDLENFNAKNQILKIDIESSEWEFFDGSTAAQLSSFTQIVGEFHEFEKYHDDEWHSRAIRVLKKILETHELFHVHANNAGGHFWAGEIAVPCLWELSFALRSAYCFEEERGPFPSALDAPNRPDQPDYEITRLVIPGGLP